MASVSAPKKRRISSYILPILFCALLIVLAVLRNREETPAKAVIQPREPLTLTDAALENYLYSAGFLWAGDDITDASGHPAGTLQITAGPDGEIQAMTLSYPLPTYIETGSESDVLSSLKAKHDEAAQRGEEMFLSLFDAIAATDGRVEPRRENALNKLRQTLDTGKDAVQAANSWRFAFSLAPGEIEGAVTIQFDKVK